MSYNLHFSLSQSDNFQGIYRGSDSGGQKGQKEVNQLKIEKITYICIFCYRYPVDTPNLAKYRFRSIFYFLVCLSRAIFKESIGGQTWGSKKVKEVNQFKLENIPMDAFFGSYIHMISLSVIDYNILTSEVNEGYWR